MPSNQAILVNRSPLALAREESAYALDRIARRLNVQEERVADWEEGQRQPTLRQVEGRADETIRRGLLKQADVHTLLRLPTGIFYAQGVKANVLFFDRRLDQQKRWTQELWIYDLLSKLHLTLKENSFKRHDLDDLVSCYHQKNRRDRKDSDRFEFFILEELTKRGKVNFESFWLTDQALDESASLPVPEVTADLEAALKHFVTIAEDLK